jgi:nucleotide-binding universal stress UspA family protein
MFKRILACTDLTMASAPALRCAAGQMEPGQSRLTVLHVVPLPPEIKKWSLPIFAADVKVYRQLLDRQIAAAKAELERQLRSVVGKTAAVAIRVRSGDAADVIARSADEIGADLIVVARGHGGKLGHTAERVVRLVGRTVLVAPVRNARSLGVSGEIDLAPPPRRRRAARDRAAGGLPDRA